MERTRPVGYPAAMNESLEQRLEALEKQVAEMRGQLAVMKPPAKDWERSFGMFADDPMYESAMKLGREWREAQTYEKEIAASQENEVAPPPQTA